MNFKIMKKTANDYSLSITLLIILQMIGMIYFVFTLFVNLFSNLGDKICWEAGILAAICYGFITVQTNQLNIHSIEQSKKKMRYFLVFYVGNNTGWVTTTTSDGSYIKLRSFKNMLSEKIGSSDFTFSNVIELNESDYYDVHK